LNVSEVFKIPLWVGGIPFQPVVVKELVNGLTDILKEGIHISLIYLNSQK
jgi:hypothetical protein